MKKWGVKGCDRKGCENIMCDRYNPMYGYICDACFQELKTKGKQTNIEKFMNSKKPYFEKMVDTHDFFDRVFPWS